MSAADVKNISKRYGSFLMKDISFSLEEGSILGVIGENGAGKSTLLEIILGLVSPDEGSVSVLGCDDLSRNHEIRAQVGFVIEYAGFPDVFCADDINSILKDIYGTWDQTFYYDLLNSLDTPVNESLKKLSQGSRMKVLIASAMAHRPRLLILDEATNFLDPAARAIINNSLYDYTRDEKNTVILSSHLASDLEKIADYILFLHKGEILMYAPKDDIIDMYLYVSASPEIIGSLDPDAVIASRKTGFGAEALIRKEAANDEMQTRKASLEEIFTALVKGVI